MNIFENQSNVFARLNEIDARNAAADRQVVDMTPQQVTQLGAFQAWYPWVPKGVMYSLVRNNEAVWNNPRVQQIAIAALQQRQASAMGSTGKVGDYVGPADDLTPEQRKAQMGKEWVANHEGRNPLSRAVKPIGDKIAGIPGYSGKDLLTDVLGPQSTTGHAIRDNPVTNDVLEPLARKTVTGNDPLPRGLRFAARNAAMIGDLPRQIGVGAYRSAPGPHEIFHQNPLKTIAKWQADTATQTETGQTIQGAIKPGTTGGGVDQGSGFFIGSGAKERQHAAEQTHGVIIYPDGTRHARTPGRDLAGVFFEPGSNGYTALSGGVDLGVAISADKLTFGEVSSARQLDKAFRVEGMGPRAIAAAEEGTKASRTANLLDSAGGIWNPGRRATVSPEAVETFLAGRQGAAIVDKMAETTDLRTLDRLTGGKLHPADLINIADTTDPDEMRNIAQKLFTTGRVNGIPQSPLGRLGFELKESVPEPIRRLNQRMPKVGARARELRDARQSFSQMTREMDYLDIPEEVQQPFLRKMASPPPTGIEDPELAAKAEASWRRSVFEEFEDHVVGHVAAQIGMDDVGVSKFRKMMQREKDRLAHETNYNVIEGKPKSFFNLKVRTSTRNAGRPSGDLSEFGDITDAEVVKPGELVKPSTAAPTDWRTQQSAYEDEIRRQMAEGTFLDEDAQLVPQHMLDELWGGEGWSKEEMIANHEDAIRWHLDRGEQLPYFVMKDYPELIDEYGMTFPKMTGEAPRAGGLQRTGGALGVDDAQTAELLDEFDNPITTTHLEQPDIPTPTDINELQSEYMPSPDWRAVKQQMGSLKKLYAHGLDIPLTTIRDIQGIWKGLVIARPALFFRVVGEIQVAMTLRGAATWLTHPLDQMAWVLGDAKVPDTLEAMGKGGTDIMGRRFGSYEDNAGEWHKTQERWMEMNNESTFYRQPTDAFVHDHFPIAKKSVDPEDFYLGMADEFHTIGKSTFGSMVVNNMLRGGNDDAAVAFAWHNMEDERKLLAVHFAKSDGAKILTYEGTDDYIRNVVTPRVLQATGGGNEELLQALKSGRLRDVPFDIKGVRNDELNQVLKQFADLLPDEMRVPRTLHSREIPKLGEVLRNLHGWALDVMFSNRERTLNRSPQFRKFYFKHAMANASIVSPEYADEFAANLEKAGMKVADVRQAKYHAKRELSNPDHALSLKEVDDLSFAQATDDMQFFQEDLVDKKRFIEGVSLISPFAHVLSESMIRWAKIFANPSNVAKIERPIKNLRDPATGDLLGMNEDPTDPQRRGLFYKDAQGNERVAFPLSDKMMGLIGPPVPLQGRTQGMNMIGDFSPGVGPFASFPLAAAFDHLDDPRYDGARNWIFPAGTPQGGVIEANVLGALPTWLRKAIKDETSQQQIDAMYYLAGTGKYNISGEGATQEEINRFISDAKQQAFMAKIGNAAATFFSPTAPSPEWFIDTPSGQRVPLLAVAKDIQKMRTDDPRNATINALDKYGDNVFLMLVGKTVAVSPGVLPATQAAENWIRTDGKGMRGKYKDTYGFFAPQEGDFDFDAYRRLLDNGDRKLTNPDDVPFIANDMVAKARYYALRAKLPNPSDPKQAAVLRDFRAQLQKEYPGYDPDGPPGGTINKAPVSSLIAELKASTTDKKLAGHEAMEPLKRYLALRDKIQALAPKDRGGDWWVSSKDGAGARAALAQFGDQLAQGSPAFAGMWEGALRREFEGQLVKDDATNAVGG